MALPVTYWKLTLPSAAETPGMRMPQVEEKLAPGKLWTREGELGKDETKEGNSWAVSLDSQESLSQGPQRLGAQW